MRANCGDTYTTFSNNVTFKTLASANTNGIENTSSQYLEENAMIHSVRVSPLPAQSILYVQLTGYAANITLQLQDIEGRTVKQQKLQAASVKFVQQIDVAGLSNGIYFLNVIDEKGNRQTEKVIVSK